MQKTIIHISLTLRGPLLTQSSNPGQLGLDAVIARNHRDQVYIPGTLVSGKIRQSLEELLDAVTAGNKPVWFAPDLDNWLGKVSEYDFAKTKRLFFSDFILSEDEPSTATRYRIKIDPESESVGKHQLAILESPFISGESYTFTGQAQFFSSSTAAPIITQHLQAAIEWLFHLGAFGSIGFGQVEKATIYKKEIFPIPAGHPVDQTVGPERIGFCIQPEYPFCLAGKPSADNLFQSEVIIPGGAIKGCIVTTWNHALDLQSGRIEDKNSDLEALRENFSKLRFSHAFPGSITNKRPLVAPLSLVKTSKNSPFYDVALLRRPSLIADQAPDFAVDWKDTNETLKEYPWPYIRFKEWGWDSLDYELRVRTAIDREKLRSKESELFAYEQIIPTDKNWYGELDLTQVETQSRNDLLDQLKKLCIQGLIGLGKTKTPLRIEFTEAIEPAIPNDLNPVETDLWLITLQTDALIGSPEMLDETSGETELRAMYETAWHELSDGKLMLLRYFARQRLSGGRHRQKTMQNCDTRYRPWLLTEAGSIFVLQSQNNADLKVIEDIKKMILLSLSQGLPITESVRKWYRLGDDPSNYWQYTPFVPENGYGEIAVNLQHETVVQIKSDGTIAKPITMISCEQKRN